GAVPFDERHLYAVTAHINRVSVCRGHKIGNDGPDDAVEFDRKWALGSAMVIFRQRQELFEQADRAANAGFQRNKAICGILWKLRMVYVLSVDVDCGDRRSKLMGCKRNKAPLMIQHDGEPAQ